jgi:DNA-binding Lrp family transcriptional regulator
MLSLVADIAELIGKSNTAVRRVTAKLQHDGMLKFIGLRAGCYWQVL